MAVLRIDIAGNPRNIPYRTFLDVATNSLAVLSDLDRAFSSRHDGALEWYINDLAKNGALRVEVISRVRKLKFKELPDVGREVARSFVNGFDMLEHQGRSPSFLTAAGMYRAQRMTSVLGHDGAQKLIASVLESPEETEITANSANNLKKLMPEAYRSVGSIEGFLEGISVHNKLDVVVYESIHGKAVTCHIANSDLLPKIKESLGKRVKMTGEISRNSKSEARRVNVVRAEDFKVFGMDMNVLPFRKLGGIDPDFTAGLTTEEFIRQIRG